MTAAHGLAGVIVAFAAILAAILAMAFRERRVQRVAVIDAESARASDARVLVAIFVAIPAGMLLTLVSAWLVFF
jgi:hypothetical protein